MASAEFSRREMIGLIGAGMVTGGAIAFGGWKAYEYFKPEVIPSYDQEHFPLDHPFLPAPHESLADINPDPLFRAANVSVTIGVEGSAHASLIDTGSDLVLSTAEHVASAVQTGMISIVEIPGVGMTPLNPDRFVFGQKKGEEWETSAFYVFGEENETVLRQAVTDQKIQPLRMHTGKPRRGEVVAIPRGEYGMYAYYQSMRFHPHENLLELEGFSQNCKGDSGAPILQLSDRTGSRDAVPTGLSYGCLQGVYKATRDAEGRECSSTILARPHG